MTEHARDVIIFMTPGEIIDHETHEHHSIIYDVLHLLAGGDAGLTGDLASCVREGQGKVVGVLSKSLVQHEVSGPVPEDTRIVADLHEQKAEMAAESEAFLALPGGYDAAADIHRAK